MILKTPIFAATLVIVFGGCNLSKKAGKTTTATNMPVINLDTIVAKPKTAEVELYQASATRKSDIIHTKLEVSFDWNKQYMFGKATITVKPYFYPTAMLELDARGMEIKEVALIKTTETSTPSQVKQSKKGKIYEPAPPIVTKTTTKIPLQYKYENDILAIQLDKEYKNTEEYTVFIDYVAKPEELKKGGGSAAISDDKGLYFINPLGKEKDKPKQIWTQGETQSSSVWFPTIDHPNERMTQEIVMTVDNKYVTLSNGELAFSSDNGDGTRTDDWKMDLPAAPYLSMMAVGEFAIVKDKWKDKEVNYYVEKEYEPYAKAIFGNTPEMLEFFSNKLGVQYAWNKYSQIVVRDYVSGAMENTTATLHGEFMQRTDRELIDRTNEDVISHELFHQWFGDLVTTESWSNTPLNESFATYGEYLWNEYKYGVEAADMASADSREGYLNEAKRKRVPLIRFQYEDKEDMFDRHSYNKGGQVLHMLRKYVGDDAFFASLKLYLETNKFSPVEVHNLRLAFEQITGEDLNWFFNQWFLAPGHPELVIKYNYDEANKKEKVQIKQVQDLSKYVVFKIPMNVDVYVNGKVDRQKITITKSDETFEFDAATKPDLVNVDAEKMLLCNKVDKKSVNEWAFQYNHAPLYMDRYEALAELSKLKRDSVANVIVMQGLSDKFWSLRDDAIGYLKFMEKKNEKLIKDKLCLLAKSDEKSTVRTDAIEYLSTNYKDEDLIAVYKNALNDKSYSVLGAALAAIAKTSSAEGMKIAKQYEGEKNHSVLVAVADVYADYGSDENNDFFVNSKDKFEGFSKVGFITSYGAFLTKVKNDATVNSGVALLEDIAKDEESNKYIVYYSKKMIKDIISIDDDRIKTNSDKLKSLKEANPNIAGTQELEAQIESAKAQKQKIEQIYNGIK
jgi:aminopeptidase N